MNSILRFGCLYGLALVFSFYLSHLLLGTDPDNFTKGEIVGYSVMIISSLAVVMGIKEFKQKRAPAPLGFMNGLGVGLGISFIAASIFALYNWFYLAFINPEFTATYIQYSEQQIRSSGLDPVIIEQQLAELAHYAELMSSNFNQSVVMFATVFIIGLLFSVVTAIALRTSQIQPKI
ncbi:DUF4199 domain-containing protein [uncultured Paraglaciecola sp.]|uniref:DUF4199 domain-containing protein n=1 Tax=uncultured Paraglaciecola sp. TaxID=1765024 RepID=UPI0030D9680F|tara:strand:- start:9494 stop:10024 length:531 start_codon:yes stop_codon:yes gene_type:complete